MRSSASRRSDKLSRGRIQRRNGQQRAHIRASHVFKYLKTKYPESFDPTVDEKLIYCGGKKLTDPVDIGGGRSVTAGKLVLSPTRTYAPIVAKLLKTLRANIHGMVHCSGGGQTKILHFLSTGTHVVKDNMFPTPPLFNLIQKESKTDWKEMYKVFNMGHRLRYTYRKGSQGSDSGGTVIWHRSARRGSREAVHRVRSD